MANCVVEILSHNAVGTPPRTRTLHVLLNLLLISYLHLSRARYLGLPNSHLILIHRFATASIHLLLWIVQGEPRMSVTAVAEQCTSVQRKVYVFGVPYFLQVAQVNICPSVAQRRGEAHIGFRGGRAGKESGRREERGLHTNVNWLLHVS